MAIEFTVALNPLQHQSEQQVCRRDRSPSRSHPSHVCPNKLTRRARSRGPSHDGTNSDELVVKLLPLVKRVAFQLRSHLPAHVELDDLVSEGTIGLIDAVRKFDPGRGVTIESYARYRIRGAILDSLRDQDHASRDMRRRIKKIESTCQEIERQLGRPAGDSEMAEAMGLSLEKWYERLGELRRLGFEGPAARIAQEVGRRVNEDDLPAGSETNPFALCYRREQRDLLSSALGCLAERERLIMTLYYGQLLTMKQIGARLGIDESRVSQLHSGALVRLRNGVANILRPRQFPSAGCREARRPAPEESRNLPAPAVSATCAARY